MKILLVYPRFERFLEAYPNLAAIPTIGGLWRYRMPPALGTQILAAMMPSDVEWTIVDENVQAIDYDQEVDCVGISFFTPQAESAYAVGDRFRARGVPVLMGGMHPSIIPDDAAPHCDSICLGEVEALWPEILADLRAGGLKPRYGPRTPTASEWVRPVRGLFDDPGSSLRDGRPTPAAVRGCRDAVTQRSDQADRGGGYDWKPTLLQIARGCPRPCLYCNLPALQGSALRFRPIDDVVDEVRGMQGRDIYVTEDVIMFRARSIEQYTIELFERFAELDVHLFLTSSLVFNTRPAFLDALAAGHTRCNYITLGFDPISRGIYSGDQRMIDKTRQQIDAMQERGIRFHAAFGVGFDEDDPGVFERILRFCRQSGIVTAEFFIATPFPNTPLWHQLSREGRIHHRRWGSYNGGHVVFTPKQMTPEELIAGFLHMWTEHYTGIDVQEVLAPFDHVARAPGVPRTGELAASARRAP
jgi:radical SAM superfamily enzyme YgiQ (UPF0313 family)